LFQLSILFSDASIDFLLTFSTFSYAKMSDENENQPSAKRSLLDEFLANNQIIDDLLNEATVVVQSSIKGLQKEASDHQFHPRKHIKRPREEAHQKLVNDYFSENPLYPSNIFHRRFRMSRPLFQRIVDALGQWSDYFTQRVDAINR
jgi:hypothetical protein